MTEDFKMPFEHETKLLMKDGQLFNLYDNKPLMYFGFQKTD